MTHLILALLGALLVVPSSNLQRFDGLPLSSPLEFSALILIVPLAASRSLRRLLRRALERAGWLARGVLLGATLLALAAKLMLLASGAHEGFLACYRSPLRPPASGSCEHSWENPLLRYTATRLDRFIDIEPAALNLSFFNSLRFNFSPTAHGKPRRDRLPLEVTWRGEVEHGEAWVARVTYVGQATVTIGATTWELPLHYGAPIAIRVSVPPGRHPVSVYYRFDDGSRIGGEPPTGPYATLRLAREEPGGREAPVPGAAAGRGWRALADLGDGLVTLLVVLCSLPLVLTVLPAWPVLLPAAAFGALARPLGLVPVRVGPTGTLVVFGLLLLVMLRSSRPRTRLGLFLAVMLLSLALAGEHVWGVRTVVYRSAGDDWLTYESFARTILETWSLQGGENVFYYQPLFRYVRFGQRVLLGDGDLLVLTASLGVLLFGVFWAIGRLAGRRRLSWARMAWILGVGLLLLALFSSPTIIGAVLAPLSEQVTWIALVFLFPALVTSPSPRMWAMGAMLAGLTIATRPNQAPAVLLLVLLLLVRAVPRRPRGAVVAAGLFLATALLPLAHNLYYGGQWVLFTDAQSVHVALARSVRLLEAGYGVKALALVWKDTGYLLFLPLVGGLTLKLVAHGLQLAWLVAAVQTLRAWSQASRWTVALLALPSLYLVVYLVFEVRDYFPRHVIAAYGAMGLVAAHVASRSPWRWRRAAS